MPGAQPTGPEDLLTIEPVGPQQLREHVFLAQAHHLEALVILNRPA